MRAYCFGMAMIWHGGESSVEPAGVMPPTRTKTYLVAYHEILKHPACLSSVVINNKACVGESAVASAGGNHQAVLAVTMVNASMKAVYCCAKPHRSIKPRAHQYRWYGLMSIYLMADAICGAGVPWWNASPTMPSSNPWYRHDIANADGNRASKCCFDMAPV